jgi:2-phospho-L-lactate guanylyltransferase (CobY/MobA/RfbA family)
MITADMRGNGTNVLAVKKTTAGITFNGFNGFLSRSAALNLARWLIVVSDPALALWLASLRVENNYPPAHDFRKAMHDSLT